MTRDKGAEHPTLLPATALPLRPHLVRHAGDVVVDLGGVDAGRGGRLHQVHVEGVDGLVAADAVRLFLERGVQAGLLPATVRVRLPVGS